MLSKNKLKNYVLTLLILLTGALVFSGQANALKIIPPRLVVKADEKIQHMFIKNNSNKVETYRFSWKHLAMDKEGNILNLDKIGMDKAPPGYKPVDDIVRFSPRRAVLQPGQTQRITFMMRRGPEFPAGEYRSHFLVMKEPDPNDAIKNDAPKTNEDYQNQSFESGNKTEDKPLPPQAEGQPSVEVEVSVSRAVPVYVLNGETNASLKLLSTKLKPNSERTQEHQPKHLVEFKVQKEGNRSIIGQAKVYCTSGGQEVMISKSPKTFAIYAEGEFRDEIMAVDIPAAGCSGHRIVINAHPDDSLAGQILADSRF